MKKRSLLLIPLALMCFSALKVEGKEQKMAYGIVSFPSCMSESKYGKMEQESFQKMQEQLSTLMSDNNKKLKEIKTKLEDPELMDALSPDQCAKMEAEKEALEAERGQVHSQYFQMMQGGQYKMAQAINGHVAEAAEKVRKKLSIPLIVREEACFSYEPQLDITKLVIEQMDASFAEEHKEAVNGLGTAPAA